MNDILEFVEKSLVNNNEKISKNTITTEEILEELHKEERYKIYQVLK